MEAESWFWLCPLLLQERQASPWWDNKVYAQSPKQSSSRYGALQEQEIRNSYWNKEEEHLNQHSATTPIWLINADRKTFIYPYLCLNVGCWRSAQNHWDPRREGTRTKGHYKLRRLILSGTKLLQRWSIWNHHGTQKHHISLLEPAAEEHQALLKHDCVCYRIAG